MLFIGEARLRLSELRPLTSSENNIMEAQQDFKELLELFNCHNVKYLAVEKKISQILRPSAKFNPDFAFEKSSTLTPALSLCKGEGAIANRSQKSEGHVGCFTSSSSCSRLTLLRRTRQRSAVATPILFPRGADQMKNMGLHIAAPFAPNDITKLANVRRE